MKMWILVLLMNTLLTAPALATPLTWNFTGAQGFDGGMVTGTLTYDSLDMPSAVNVRGTQNTVYALQSWSMTINPIYGGWYGGVSSINGSPLTVTWSNTLAGNSSELCLGTCILSASPYDRLFFTNGLQSLQLLWQPLTIGGLPQTLEEWGLFAAWTPATGGGTWFRSQALDGTLQVEAMLTAGALTSAGNVPEPSSFLFLGAALLAVWLWRWCVEDWRAL